MKWRGGQAGFGVILCLSEIKRERGNQMKQKRDTLSRER